eukprot:537356-Pleurochrysis_carterae.AAC.1
MRSAGELTLDISGSSEGLSENLDLAPTRRSRGRSPSSPSHSGSWIDEVVPHGESHRGEAPRVVVRRGGGLQGGRLRRVCSMLSSADAWR